MDTDEILTRHPPGMDNLLNILHEIQDAHPLNYLPEEDLKKVARYLNTTLSSVYGVVNYYTMLSTVPRGKHIIRLCHSPVCQLMGTATVREALQKHLGVGINQPTPDGLFWVELSECLGICDVAPAMMIGQESYGYLAEDDIVNIISGIRERENNSQTPQQAGI
jgi:NADH-quinone oxidoreductase subunit E